MFSYIWTGTIEGLYCRHEDYMIPSYRILNSDDPVNDWLLFLREKPWFSVEHEVSFLTAFYDMHQEIKNNPLEAQEVLELQKEFLANNT